MNSIISEAWVQLLFLLIEVLVLFILENEVRLV